MPQDVLLSAENLSKKRSRNIRRASAQGVADILREVVAAPASAQLRPGEFWAVRDVSFDLARGESLVLACSALRESYRERLTVDAAHQRWVYLQASPELIARRMRERQGHFMAPTLLASQLALLEPPPQALVVDASRPLEEVVASIRAGLGR